MNDTTRNPTIALSDLLAVRDGEPIDLETARALEADPHARERLARLHALKAELRALPPIEPDAGVWNAIAARVATTHATPKAAKWTFSVRFPYATAASVFLAATIGIIALAPSGPRPASGGDGQVAYDLRVAGLMQRSQLLEAQVAPPSAVVGWNSSQEALMYRIADIDTELDAFAGDSVPQGAGRKAQLWAKRVQLLEDLREVQRGQARLRPAVM